MNVSIENLVSISDASQDFLKVTRLVDERGTAVILKNNSPRYVLLDFNLLKQDEIADNGDVSNIAARILSKHLKAFEALAK